MLLSRVLPRFMALARPGERVSVLIRSDAAGVSFLFPPSVEVMTYDWRRFGRSLLYRWRLSADLRKRGFRLVVSTDYDRHPLVDDELVTATGAEAFAEVARPWRKFEHHLDNHRARFSRLFEPGHWPTHRFIRLVRLANWATGRNDPVPSLLHQDGLANARPRDPRLFILHPFAGDPRKNATPDVFHAVLRSLPRNARVLLSAAPGDLDRAPEFRTLLDDRRVILDVRSLRNKFARLRQARAIVAVDTALAHLAIVAGAPTICIGTAAYVDWAIPYDPRMSAPHARFIVPQVDCAGCLGSCRHALQDGRFPCVADHSAERVVAALESLTRAAPLCA